MVLLLSYDLRGKERPENYEAVATAIKGKAISYRRPLYSQWLVETDESPQVWSDLLSSVADEDDGWLVVRVQPPYQGWLASDVWEWLRPRV